MVQIPTGNRQFYDTTTKQSTVGTYAQALKAPASAIGEEIDHIQHVKIMSQMADAKQKIGLKLEELKNQYENDPENEGFNKALSAFTKSVYSEMRGNINPLYRGVFDMQAESLNKAINNQNEFWKFKQQGVNLQNDMQKIGESLLLDAYENGQNMDYQSAIDNFENNMLAIIPAANKYLGSEKTEKAVERMREAYLYQFAQGAIENNPDQAEALLNNDDFRKQAGAENVMKLKNALKNYKAKLYKQQQTQALRNAKDSMKALKELQRQAIRDERKRMKELEKERREQIKEQKREESYRKKEGLELGKEVLADLRDRRNFLDALEKEEEEKRKYEIVENASNMLSELNAEEEDIVDDVDETKVGSEKPVKTTKEEKEIQRQKRYEDWLKYHREHGYAPNKRQQDFYDVYGYYPTEEDELFYSAKKRYATTEERNAYNLYGRWATQEEEDYHKETGEWGTEKQIEQFVLNKRYENMQKEIDETEIGETASEAKDIITDSIINSVKNIDETTDDNTFYNQIVVASQKILKQAEAYGGKLNAEKIGKYQDDLFSLYFNREVALLLPNIQKARNIYFGDIPEVDKFIEDTFSIPGDDLYFEKYKICLKILNEAKANALNAVISGDNKIEQYFIEARKQINRILYPGINKVGETVILNSIAYKVVDIPPLGVPKLKKV